MSKIQKTEAEYLSLVSKTLPKFLKIKSIRVDKRRNFVEKMWYLGINLQYLCKEIIDFHLDKPSKVWSSIHLKFNIDLEYFVDAKNGFNAQWYYLSNEGETKYLNSKDDLSIYFSEKDFLPSHISIEKLNLSISTLSNEFKFEQKLNSF